jgi:hypothetical protein
MARLHIVGNACEFRRAGRSLPHSGARALDFEVVFWSIGLARDGFIGASHGLEGHLSRSRIIGRPHAQ